MAVVRYKKGTKTYKLFGFPVCVTERDCKHKKKHILNLIKKERSFENYKEVNTLSIKDKTLYKRVETSEYVEYSIPQIFSFRKNKFKEIKNELTNLVDSKYTKVFILVSNIGEAYYFLRYIINQLITEEDVPLIITDKKAHLELIDMLIPNVDSLYVKKYKYDFSQDMFKIGSQIFYVMYNLKFYLDAENEISTSFTNYPDIMMKHFGLYSRNVKPNRIVISDEAEKSVNDYLIRNDIDEFIFLSDSARTCEKISEEFWQTLQANINLPIIKNTKDLPLDQAYELAKRSKAIITQRSGLSELLSDIEKPHIVIYTGFRDRYKFNKLTAQKAILGYSLKHYKGSSSTIKEFCYEDMSETQLIKNIVDTINKKEIAYENNHSSRGQRYATW